MSEKKPPLLKVRGLKKHFPIEQGLFRRVVGVPWSVRLAVTNPDPFSRGA
jgi:hypothetical protein